MEILTDFMTLNNTPLYAISDSGVRDAFVTINWLQNTIIAKYATNNDHSIVANGYAMRFPCNPLMQIDEIYRLLTAIKPLAEAAREHFNDLGSQGTVYPDGHKYIKAIQFMCQDTLENI